MVAELITAHHARMEAMMGTPLMASTTWAPDYVMLEAEKERAVTSLVTFKKFNMPIFDRETIYSWIMES